MFKNYFLSSIRNLSKYKWVSLISIFGLSIGIAAGLLSYMHIKYEVSYDRFLPKHERIFRLVTGDVKSGDGWVGISAPIPVKLKTEIPEIESYVRLTKFSRHGKVVVHYDNQYFNEENFFLADSSLFSIFDIPLIRGKIKGLFNKPNSLVISQSKATKIFGDEDPIGKIITMNNDFEYEVTGIMVDLPRNSHIDIDFVVSFLDLERLIPGRSLTGNWGQYNYYGYVLLRPDVDPKIVERKIQSLSVPLPDYVHKFADIGLQPITDIHFVHNRGNLKLSYNKRYLNIYGAAALGLILISLINFINLKTASSSKRIKEVGVRKTIGASRRQLLSQFVVESMILCMISLLLALALIQYLMLPYINSLFNVEMEIDLANYQNLLVGAGIILIISILSGGHIGLFVTSFSPVKVLKNQFKTGGGRGAGVKDILLGIQFIVSIILISSSLMIGKQVNHISNKNLGLNPDQVINIPLYTKVENEEHDVIKNELIKLNSVKKASLNRFNPGVVNWNQTVWWEGQEVEESMFIISVDADFLETMDVELLEGDVEFIQNSITDRYTYILNESAKKHIGWEVAQGKQFSAFGEDSRNPIAGVIKDFHFQSLHNQIKPCLLVVGNLTPSQLYLKIASTNVQQTLTEIQQKLTSLIPGLPFEYKFIDDEFAMLYESEIRAQKITAFYTFICILLAAFGLYGLLTFEISERTKEIAIRRILGSTNYQIGNLLTKNFYRIVFITGVFGIPVTWMIMEQWLSNFNYRINIDPWTISLSVVFMIFLILGTIFFKLWGTMGKEPAHDLRHE